MRTDGYLIPILQRPKRVDCSTWAELNRFMPSTHTLFSFLQTPFFREPTRYLSDLAGTSRIILCTPAQVGKTTAIENFLGWIATYDRANTLLIFDRLKTGQKMSKNRLRPFLRDTCGINTTGQAGTKYRNPDASKEVCNISLATGANLMIGSSSSASDLCSTPAKFLCCDELDRWKDELKDGGILSLAYFALLNTARFCWAICKERDVRLSTSLSLQIRSLARAYVLDLRSARIRHAALPRLYGFIGCCIFNHSFCFSLVSTFCNRLICSIDFIFNFRNKLAVNPRFREFHCIQVRYNAIINECE